MSSSIMMWWAVATLLTQGTTATNDTLNATTEAPPPSKTTVPTTTATVMVATSRSSVRDGWCSRYQGQMCNALLNETIDEQQDKPLRFIDSRLGFNRTEWIILQFMKAIDRIDEGESYCKGILKVIVCQYTLPPCDVYGLPRNYCREDCDKIFQTCDRALGELLGAAKSITDFLGIDFVHIGIPNCTQFKYSTNIGNANQSCLHLGFFDFSTEKPTEKPTVLSVVWMVVGVVCGVLLLLLVAAVAYVLRKRICRRQKHGFQGVTFTAVTMRDRLRADTLRALDESKVLSLYNPDDLVQFPLDQVQYVKDLGEGNFGQVFQGRAFGVRPADKPDTELMVAVKTLKEGCSKETKAAFLQEVTLMAVLHHPNIVQLLAVSTEEEPYGMIFEFMSKGDLNQHLRDLGPYLLEDDMTDKPQKESLTQKDLLCISLQVSSGMEHLQRMRFVHRDLATRNCLVGEGLVVKIADFGMSRDVYASDYYKVEGQAVMPIRWMPPEALLYGKFTVESDVYSFGVLLWEVYAFALQPYYGYTNEEVVEFVKKGVHLGKPEDCPDHIYNVMKNCWKKDPWQRPNFEMIIAQLKNEDVVCDVPMETPSTDPPYMNTTPQLERASSLVPGGMTVEFSPEPKLPNSYVNVGVDGDHQSDMSCDHACAARVNPIFEEGEQEI